MTAAMRQFTLHPREKDGPTIATEDLGRTMTAAEVAELICEGRFSATWIIKRFGPKIGSKPGREWLFREAEARALWNELLAKGRAR